MFGRLIPGRGKFFALTVLTLFLAVAATAQEPSTTSSTSVTGTVVSTTPTTLTIRNDSGEELTLNMDSSTRLPKSMVPGSRVRVNIREAGGQSTAGAVTLIESYDLFSEDYASRRGSSPTPAGAASPDVASGAADVAESSPAGTPGEEGAAASAQADETIGGDEQLPATASPLPLIGLAGLLSLGGAAGFRLLARRR